MKKRLLITSALMTAVLGASLATGTYAWYQAQAGSLQSASTTVEVSTAENEYSVGNVSLTLSLTNNETPDLVNNAGETWYWTTDAYTAESPKVKDETNTKYGTLTLAVTSSNTAQELASIAGTYNITITDDCATNNVYYADGENPYAGTEGQYVLTVTISDAGVISLADNNVNYSVMANETGKDVEVEITFTATLSTTPNA